AISSNRLAEFDQAITAVANISIENLRSKKTSHKYGFFSFAYAYAMAKLAGSALYDDSRFNAIAEEAIELGRSEDYRGVEKITMALAN
ncbi:hypothetical protein, partial [Pseudomonas asplenii]|uniref:hypothetical protein n=1 Tax=Pseudomonas asplenii TaxID=53407 RepID=UPI0012F82059